MTNLKVNSYAIPWTPEEKAQGCKSVNEEQLLRDLGIEWKGSWGKAILDLVVYTGCTNIPDKLPEWVVRCDDRGGTIEHGDEAAK